MKAKHTPGPWTIERSVNSGEGEITIHCGDIMTSSTWALLEQAALAAVEQ